MSESILWWQLSDLHWPSTPEPERIAFAHALAESLQHLLDAGEGTPSFIAFTGDLAQSGQAAEYASLEKYVLDPIVGLFPSEQTVPLLMVPGNHDMNRAVAQNLNSARITSVSSPAEVDGLLADSRTVEMFTTPFRDYAEFSERRHSACYLDPLTWSFEQNHGEYSLQIVGTNSAWSSYYREASHDASDERHLFIGSYQVPRQENRHSHRYRFFMMHHPIDWLNRDACQRAEQRIRGEFDLLLFGHVHSVRDLQLSQTPTSTCVFVPSPLLYERPYEESIAFPRGLVVGKLDLSDGRVEVRYLRFSDVLGSARLLPYTDIYPANAQCFDVSLRVGHDATRARTGTPATSSLAADFVTSPFLERAAARLREDHPEAASCLDRQARSVTLVRHLVRALIDSGALTTLGGADEVAAAYLLAEFSIAQAADGNPLPLTSTLARSVLGSDLKVVGGADLDVLGRLFATLRLGSLPDSLAGAAFPGCQVSLLYALFWGIGQYTLLLDRAAALASGGGRRGRPEGAPTEGVLSVAFDAVRSRVVIRLAATTRTEFHQAAEVQHTVDQYLSEVEDLWRRSGMMPPSIRIDLEFPLWRSRSIESHYLGVEQQPVARLLMGRALYGARRHVWIRELVQNALDATEMRRLMLKEANYVPQVTLRLLDGDAVAVTDNGIGMNYQQVVGNLATLGRSGWRMHETNDKPSADAVVYGRFGIGFASVFGDAKGVQVVTRPANSRSVDGLSVRFSQPDRPYFVESALGEEGTMVAVELNERLDRATFATILKELFVYLPTFVAVEPDPGVARDLESASILDEWPTRLPLKHRFAHTTPVTIGGRAAALKVELLVLDEASRVTSRSTRDFPWSRLTVAVDGMRVFDQDALTLRRTGQSIAEEAWKERTEALQFWNCYVTLDLDRQGAPVSPARDAIITDQSMMDETRVAIEEGVAGLLAEMARTAGSASTDPAQKRKAILASLEGCIDPSHRWNYGTWGPLSKAYSGSDIVTRAAADVYGRDCPVAVCTAKGERSLVHLNEIAREEISAVVSRHVADGRTFPAFARLKELSKWLVIEDRSEAALVASCWRTDGGMPTTLISGEDLFRDSETLLPEVREGHLVSLLRGDYALARSAVFGSALYLVLPGLAHRTSRHRGARQTRDQVTQPPRVVLNADHPIVMALERFLVECTEEQTARLRLWLTAFCDGVIEDKTKLAPEARWTRLRNELGGVLGVEVAAVPFEALSVSF